MLAKKDNKLALTTGLALFAMFFGAGNLIFPLAIGVHAGSHLFTAWVGFMIAGVGLPFLGLFAISLYEGNYWSFFNSLGKYLGFAVVTFIILIIGPLFAAPRTEDITYSSIQPFLPHGLDNHFFSVVYFGLILLLSYKHTSVIDIIGRFISPIKLTAFIILILASLITASAILPSHHSVSTVFTHSLSVGYGTMDLLGAFFFCHVAYVNTVHKCTQLGLEGEKPIRQVMLKACLIGGLLIAAVYTGFMLSAATHADVLQHASTPALINKLSDRVLGNFGSLFVGACVTLACIATATALTVVSTNFFYRSIFFRKLPRLACLIIVLAIMYVMSILGFDKLMEIATPILNVLYPCLIVLCVVNIARKLCSCRGPSRKHLTAS